MKSAYVLLLMLLLGACRPSTSSHVEAVEGDTLPTATEIDTVQRLTLLFAGDLMQHGVQYKAAWAAGGGKTYDYTDCFRYVKEEISRASVAIANFETTLAGGRPSTYPQFNSPDEYLHACKDAGFDLFLTANNHSCDKGARGIRRTLQMMDSLGLGHVGTYVDAEAREVQYPYLLEREDFRIALLNYTYDTNGIPVPTPYIVNLLDTVQMAKDIRKAKEWSVDAIIACLHWGVEHAMVPNQAQRDLADWLFRQGVTHIIGGHPHVVQPLEVREDSVGERHLLAYSLGNFISNMSQPCNEGGMLVKLELTKRSGEEGAHLSQASYALTWVSRPEVSKRLNFRVYPASVPLAWLNAQERESFQATLSKERRLLRKHNKQIEEYLFDTPPSE